MTPTIRELVEPWFKIMTALDNAWDSWRDLGVGIEAPFPDAAWQLSGAYTESVGMHLNHLWGIEGAWLGWFLWDKPEGSGKAIIDGVEWNIVTIDDLIEMLNSIAKPGGGIEANGGSVDA
jgi:hypothetical protein